MNILCRVISHGARYSPLTRRFAHYLTQANPIHQPGDLVTGILKNIVHHDDQVIVFNKPPGVMVLDETWDRKTEASADDEDQQQRDSSPPIDKSPCTIQYFMPQFRAALKWDHFFPCIRTPNEPSGLLIYTRSAKFHDDIKSTAMRSFRKSKEPYLTFYGITTAIPRKLEDSHHLMIERHLYRGDYLSYEVFDATSNALKHGQVYTGTVKHRTLATNDKLQVALVEFRTTTCTWDFVQIYSLRQCSPLLGDHKYSNRVKSVAGIPMYINPVKHEIYPAKQQLSKHVRLALDVYGQKIECPLHLHLTDFNLPKKYRGQRAVVHYRARPLPYFFETLNRLELKFPADLDLNEPAEENKDLDFEHLINGGLIGAGNGSRDERTPGVYVTSAIVARQGKVLDEFGITHVISIQGKPISPFAHREYLLIPAKDHISQDLLQFAGQCNDFIHSARLNRGKVLIHCVEGKSRSPSIASIYIMTVTGLSWSDTINSLRGVRTLVDPNFAFQRQLKHFYDQLMPQERERLFTKFGRFLSVDDDISFALRNLGLYNEEQRRRLAGNVIDIAPFHVGTKQDASVASTEQTPAVKHDETNTRADGFFLQSDAPSMTLETQTLLDDMFSS